MYFSECQSFFIKFILPTTIHPKYQAKRATLLNSSPSRPAIFFQPSRNPRKEEKIAFSTTWIQRIV